MNALSLRWPLVPLLVLALPGPGGTAAFGFSGAPVAFADRTQPMGLAHVHQSSLKTGGERLFMPPGAAVADVNRDGWLDLVVQQGTGHNTLLYLNDGDGTFTDVAAEWGIDMTDDEGAAVAVGDVNGDGWPDLYLGTILGRNYLYVNTGEGAFVETAVAAGIAFEQQQPGQYWPNSLFGATFGDVDLDGDLDLYTAEWTLQPFYGNRLLINDGSGVFTDVTAAAGLEIWQNYFAFSPALLDMDGDRLPDLPVAADFLDSRYFVNNGDLTFTEMLANGTCTDENGMGSAAGDYDNDGDLDWFVTSIYDNDGVVEGNWGVTGNRLYRQETPHQFSDATDDAGVHNGGWGWGASFADFNHDGWLDLTMTNGFSAFGSNPDPTFLDDRTRLWISGGPGPDGPVFQDIALSAGLVHTSEGKSLVVFDADNDGDLDIAITSNRGAFAYFRNQSELDPQSWLQVDLVAPRGNAPDGFGAVVRLTSQGLTQMRPVHGGMTFMGQNPARVHFGFPATGSIESLEVSWPDGSRSLRLDVAAGQIITIMQGDLNGDLGVGTADLLLLLQAWGPCDVECPADMDASGEVDITDLIRLLFNWS